MNLKKTLSSIATIVSDEAARNPELRARLEEAIADGGKMGASRASPATAPSAPPSELDGSPKEDKRKRKGGRRSLAVLDPVDLATKGEAGLRSALSELDLERLHDIVAQYGMDPGKLVMKWRDRDRVADRIIEVALARATKGDSFRKD